jgi:hypothetical protein
VHLLNSIRSKPALVLSLALLLAFLFAAHVAVQFRPTSGELAWTIFGLLHPSIKQHPGLWFAAESIVLLAGSGGLVLFGFAVSGASLGARFRQASALLRRSWRLVVWVLLFGHLLPSVIAFLQLVTGALSLPNAPFVPIMYLLLASSSPPAGFYCAARLLFGSARWRIDTVLGYVAAGIASFDVALHVVSIIGLGQFLPILGIFRTGALGSGHNATTWTMVSVAIVWAGLTLARQSLAGPLIRNHNRVAALYCVLGGLVFSVAVQKSGFYWPLLSNISLWHTAIYAGLIGTLGVVALLCLGDGLRLLTGDGDQPQVTSPSARSAARSNSN